MKKITPVEIIVLIITAICVLLYLSPKIMLTIEQRQYTRIQTNAAMMTSKILSEFSNSEQNELPSVFSKKLADEMNKLVKNPIDKNNPAYSIEKECLGCVAVAPDDKVKSVVLSGKDKNGNLVVRTVIQPPSYVTYNKEFNKK